MSEYLTSDKECSENNKFERSQGEVLILERFFDLDHKGYRIQKIITPAEWFAVTGRSATGLITPYMMSDWLVESFDAADFIYFGVENATLAFRLPDGRTVHQHST